MAETEGQRPWNLSETRELERKLFQKYELLGGLFRRAALIESGNVLC